MSSIKGCTAPAVVKDWELEQVALFANARTWEPHVREHVGQCAACKAEIQRICAENEMLRRALKRADCPTRDDLREYKWQALPQWQMAQIGKHLINCSRCTEEVAMFAGPAPIAQEATLTRIRNKVKRIVATLIPPATPTLAFNTRGEDDVVLRYAIPGHEAWKLLLWPQDTGQAHSLRVELSGKGSEAVLPTPVKLLGPRDVTVLDQELDETGEANFHSLDLGAYTLRLELADEWIEIHNLEIGRSDAGNAAELEH